MNELLKNTKLRGTVAIVCVVTVLVTLVSISVFNRNEPLTTSSLIGVCVLIGLAWSAVRFFEFNMTRQQAMEVKRRVDEGHSYFREVIRFFPDGGVGITDGQGIIIECNVNFAKLMGYLSTREVIGKSVNMFAPDPAQHAVLVEGIVTDIVERRVKPIRADGGELTILLSVHLLSDGNRFFRVKQVGLDEP